MFLIIFEQKPYLENIHLLFILILLGTFIGNYFATYIKEKTYKNLINFLCFITCIILLTLS